MLCGAAASHAQGVATPAASASASVGGSSIAKPSSGGVAGGPISDFDQGGDTIQVTGGAPGSVSSLPDASATAAAAIPASAPNPPAAAPSAEAAAAPSTPQAQPSAEAASAPAPAPSVVADTAPAPAVAPAAVASPAAEAASEPAAPAGAQAAASRRHRERTQVASVPPEEQSKGGGFGGFGGFSSNSKSPVAIKGDTLDYDDQTGTAVWTGHVHAKQDTGEMTCDRLKVLFDKNTHQVNQMWSDGNVRISQGENYETGDHAHFDSGQHTVVLTGSPVAHNGENQITGDKMTVILDGPDKGKVKVEHARVVVFPHSTESKDNGAGTTPKL